VKDVDYNTISPKETKRKESMEQWKLYRKLYFIDRHNEK
jgi:hypothetical protein